jgi:hypothetical protein
MLKKLIICAIAGGVSVAGCQVPLGNNPSPQSPVGQTLGDQTLGDQPYQNQLSDLTEDYRFTDQRNYSQTLSDQDVKHRAIFDQTDENHVDHWALKQQYDDQAKRQMQDRVKNEDAISDQTLSNATIGDQSIQNQTFTDEFAVEQNISDQAKIGQTLSDQTRVNHTLNDRPAVEQSVDDHAFVNPPYGGQSITTAGSIPAHDSISDENVETAMVGTLPANDPLPMNGPAHLNDLQQTNFTLPSDTRMQADPSLASNGPLPLNSSVPTNIPEPSNGPLPWNGIGSAGNQDPPAVDSELKMTDVGSEFPAELEANAQNSTLDNLGGYAELSMEEAIRIGLENSKIIRELGGTLLENPDAIFSVYDPAIIYTDPLFGEAAALSAFDATVSSQIFFDKNDREFNNQFLGTNGLVKQDLGNFQLGVTKRAATGGLFSVRSVSDYDYNNSIGNRYGNPSSSWQTYVEGELRQPLLRGGRLMVNRIAGPAAQVGEYNGILLAKNRTDISVSNFKISVRDFVGDIENAYWDLYFAYRDLEAKKMARDNALESWRRIIALGGKAGGEADKEGQAREQYFRFEAAVQDAIYGRTGEGGTRTRNGSLPGTFRPITGVKVAERRLRFLLGIPINDGQTIRPSDEPAVVPVTYDRDACIAIACENRSELKRQLKKIRAAKLQMIAAKNALLPQLDIIGRYRFRGFGQDLIGDSFIDDGGGGFVDPTNSAWSNLANGDFQEWQVGMELAIPLGFRKEYAAVRNIRNLLMREQKILDEQKRQIATDLSNALDNLERAYKFHTLQYNRLIAALKQLDAVTLTNEQKKAPLYLVLEAQRRVLDAQTQLYRAKVEYAIAHRNVEFEKGTLLEALNVNFLAQPNVQNQQPSYYTVGQ